MTLDDIVFPQGELKNDRLFYGKDENEPLKGHPLKYVVRLKALRDAELTSKYQRIDQYNEARVRGKELQLRRFKEAPKLEGVKTKASFPYDQIREYMSQSV